MGTRIAAIHPSKVPAHWTPRFSNICVAKRGKTAPTQDRIMVFAAKAEAALYILLDEDQGKWKERGKLKGAYN